ncbi:Acireductone dioxygenase [Trichinella spiralis]|uniref:Acireductone dioxygenase n=1 Tax=Trichinella spiralis TaxID=6334 RepID=A0ABR3K3V6_TRISP
MSLIDATFKETTSGFSCVLREPFEYFSHYFNPSLSETHLPRYPMYWSTELRCDAIPEAVTRNRFRKKPFLQYQYFSVVPSAIAINAVDEGKEAFINSRRARQEELPDSEKAKALAGYDQLLDLVTQHQSKANDLLKNSSQQPDLSQNTATQHQGILGPIRWCSAP